MSARMNALSGDRLLGFSITVHPAASAGATLSIAWCSGKFHGAIPTAGPIGSRTTIELATVSSNG